MRGSSPRVRTRPRIGRMMTAHIPAPGSASGPTLTSARRRARRGLALPARARLLSRRSLPSRPMACGLRAQPARPWRDRAASTPAPRARCPACALSITGADIGRREVPDHPVPPAEPDHRSLCATGDCRAVSCAMSANPSPWCWPTRRSSPRMRRSRSNSTLCRCRSVADRAASRRRPHPAVSRHGGKLRHHLHGRRSATSRRRSATRPIGGARRFRVQRQTAFPMETRGLLAEWDAAAGRLTMSGAAKLPFFNRRTLAAMHGAARDRRSITSNMTSAAGSARAANSIRRISCSRSRRESSAARSNGSRTAASIS